MIFKSDDLQLLECYHTKFQFILPPLQKLNVNCYDFCLYPKMDICVQWFHIPFIYSQDSSVSLPFSYLNQLQQLVNDCSLCCIWFPILEYTYGVQYKLWKWEDSVGYNGTIHAICTSRLLTVNSWWNWVVLYVCVRFNLFWCFVDIWSCCLWLVWSIKVDCKSVSVQSERNIQTKLKDLNFEILTKNILKTCAISNLKKMSVPYWKLRNHTYSSNYILSTHAINF